MSKEIRELEENSKRIIENVEYKNGEVRECQK